MEAFAYVKTESSSKKSKREDVFVLNEQTFP
jgi:hypothetical protein